MLDQLTPEELRALLDQALAALPASKRYAILAGVRAPPPAAPSSACTEDAHDAVAALLDFLDSQPPGAYALWGDSWDADDDARAELHALQDALAAALERLETWLFAEEPHAELIQAIEELLAELDVLECCEVDALSYGEMEGPPPRAPLDAWMFLARSRGVDPAELAAKLAERWPMPHGPSPLDAALGDDANAVGAALVSLADAGSAAAARWGVRCTGAEQSATNEVQRRAYAPARAL